MNIHSSIRLSIITLFLISVGVFGQNPIVKEIVFIGQSKTKPYIINREIQHPINVPLDSSLAEADRQRLENLGIFSMVTLQIFKQNQNEVVLRYTVIESWRFFPIITPVYDEKWGWSVGAMLMINNFRGRNESFAIQGQYGGQNTLGIEFVNPWITGDHVSLQLGAGNNIYSHTFLPYDINSNHFQLGLGKYFANNIRTKIGLKLIDRTYSNETINKNYQYIIPHLNIKYDTRDLYADPSEGILSANSIFYRLDIKGNKNNQLVWNQSTSYFKELIGGSRNMVAGVNLASLLSFSKNLDVWYDYLGGAYSVRGWKVPTVELYASSDQSYRFGMNWITASAEIRQTIIPKFATKYDNEIGLSIVAFTDIGVINNSMSELLRQIPLLGIGIGIRIPWPVIKSLRLDYGWSFHNGEYIEQSLHLAFGEKF
ncbi:MAG: BamA/TamA family outer membrane protein [Planctomycetia bacterium]|nr:BamA/TamA family outer membrane protein [Planctomycetia bacterium]